MTHLPALVASAAPAIISASDPHAAYRFLEFFTANIRNPHTRRAAVRKWHDARRYERQTRKPGHQDGALGRNGRAVLHAFLFDFINRATGELTPTRATIARAANICIRSVDRGLAVLRVVCILTR